MIYFCQKGNKWGVTDFVLERTLPEEYPKSNLKKNWASLANKGTVCVIAKILQLDL